MTARFTYLLLFLSFLLVQAGEKQVIELTGYFDGAGSPSGKFILARAVDLDAEGQIYIVDSGRHRLLKFNADGKFLKEVGGFGQKAEQFDDPRDVFARATINVFVADYNNNRIVRFDKNLNYLSELPSAFEPPYDFDFPLSVAVSSQYDLFVLEQGHNRIIKFDRNNQPMVVMGGSDEPFGQLLDPVQITLDGNRHLFVTDPAQSLVQVFDYLGNYITALKAPRMIEPTGLFWGADEKLYVVDNQNRAIFIFSKELKSLGSVAFPAEVSQAQDVAVLFDKIAGERRIYLLAPDRCWRGIMKQLSN